MPSDFAAVRRHLLAAHAELHGESTAAIEMERALLMLLEDAKILEQRQRDVHETASFSADRTRWASIQTETASRR